jgi:tRNA threonylcarbamoyladenosine biosynthesis protein TsaB
MDRKSIILALETSSRVGSVALATGGKLLDHTTFSAPLRHSAEILPTITRLLDCSGHQPEEISQVHLSVGPGSFTGLRIAVTIAKSMHLANSTTVVTVDSLDVMAANMDDAASSSLFQCARPENSRTQRIGVLLDAKRGQFFVAVYERASADAASLPGAAAAEEPGYHIPAPNADVWRKILPDCLMTATAFLREFADTTHPISLLGDGLLYHQDKFEADGVYIVDPVHWGPRAANVHRLGYQKARVGMFSDPLTLVPFYLRGPQVTLKARS